MQTTYSTPWFVHLCAGATTVAYAGFISTTPYVTSGLQFIAPILCVIATHLIWFGLRHGFVPGFGQVITTRTLQTSFVLCLLVIGSSIFAPLPAQANAGEIIGAALGILFCVGVIATIVLIVSLIIKAIVRAISSLGGPKDGPQGRLFDVGGLVILTGLIIGASLEGVPQFYSFAQNGTATKTVVIDAPATGVWDTMQTATSPDFPLPAILANFPKPTEVAIDEGTTLGAMRKVVFAGREGSGHLILQVTQQTPTFALFEVQEDTTPYANWVRYRTLSYRLADQGDTTALSVTLTYDRLLSPAWFFGPSVKGASFLAMDVLAHDVKTRAEQSG